MLGPSRTIRFALTLAYALFAGIAVAPPSPAAAGNRSEPKSEGAVSYVCGHGFEPGPIVDGHNRQPTPTEFEARRRELGMLLKSTPTAPIHSQAGVCRPS